MTLADFYFATGFSQNINSYLFKGINKIFSNVDILKTSIL